MADAEPGSIYTTVPFTVAGIDSAVPISISGGRYAIDSGDFTSSAGEVREGQSVRLELMASSDYVQTVSAELTIGGVSATWRLRTRERDTTPDALTFAEQSNVQPGTWIESNAVTVTGFEGSVALSITRGEYSIDGSEFASSDTSISVGAALKLRHRSPALLNSVYETTVSLGQVQTIFRSTTQTTNTLPVWRQSAELVEANVISTTADATNSVISADLDGDGDLDVVSASYAYDTVAWYENDGGVDPAFTKHIISSMAAGASSVSVGDLDGDGDLDVLSASFSDDTIAWYENDGGVDPAFTKRIISAVVGGASSVSVSDLDGDGDLDVLSASFSDDTIAWYENDGGVDPAFTEHTIGSAVANLASSVAVGDMDGDGDVDVLSAATISLGGATTIAWYENDGGVDPAFAKHNISTLLATETSVSVGDLDGDGDLDVLSKSESNNTIAWYENDGGVDPIFTEQTLITTAGSVSFTALADMDGDGDLDVLSASSGVIRTIAWHENDGGVDPIFIEHPLSRTVGNRSSVAVGDMDGDGDLDVLSASIFGNLIAWYPVQDRNYQAAAGSTSVFNENATDADSNVLTYSINDAISLPLDARFFSIDTSTGELTFAGAPAVSTPGDSNGDSVYEVWISVTDGYSVLNRAIAVRVYDDDEDDDDDGIPDTADAFPLDPSEWLDTDSDGIGNNADTDDDGDGVEDMRDLSPLDAQNTVMPVWVQVGMSSEARLISVTASSAYYVISADLDSDGDLDVLSASGFDDTIAWYENDGGVDPAFTEHTISSMADGAISVSVGDLDGDGDLDVLSASFNDDTIAWYENDGGVDPAFTKHTISSMADGASSVSVGDLDGDGDLDVLSTSFNDDTIAWYENDGGADPTFAEHTISTSADYARSVAVGDMDGDGDLDVLSASQFDHTIVWYENNGEADPIFMEHTITTSANGARSVAVGDVDGDGDLDVLSASYHDDTIAWYENDGGVDPTFVHHTITRTADGGSSVAVGDVDGDGDLDVLSASALDDTIAWYENDGAVDPAFTEHTVSTAANVARSVAVGDMDGDGDLDVLSASSLDSTIAWYPVQDRYYVAASGTTSVFTENATDADGNTLSYSIGDAISHPLDASFFSIDTATGELTFAGAPATSTPGDSNGDNAYEVWISVTDGYSLLHRKIVVQVTE